MYVSLSLSRPPNLCRPANGPKLTDIAIAHETGRHPRSQVQEAATGAGAKDQGLSERELHLFDYSIRTTGQTPGRLAYRSSDTTTIHLHHVLQTGIFFHPGVLCSVLYTI